MLTNAVKIAIILCIILPLIAYVLVSVYDVVIVCVRGGRGGHLTGITCDPTFVVLM